MKSLVAHNRVVELAEEEIPKVKDSYILVKTMYSAISPGTDLLMIGGSSDKKINFGYSAMGVVVECGDGITDVKKGDLVACYGAPYVFHSEYLLVPKTLYTKVPSHINPKEASLVGIGAIAIHALRTAKLQFGETVVIVGLGLLGQMIAKIAHAAAYQVIAYDLHEERVNMLRNDNIKAFSEQSAMEEEVQKVTDGNGADAVLLCIGGKRSPLTHQSLEWIRMRGKAVIVGDIAPDFPRDLMFAKEAEVLISRAAGPGRYDNIYEAQAIDYPYGFVRWTEGRNMAEYIRLIAEKRIDVRPFIKDEVKLADAPLEFESLLNKKTSILTKIIAY